MGGVPADGGPAVPSELLGLWKGKLIYASGTVKDLTWRIEEQDGLMHITSQVVLPDGENEGISKDVCLLSKPDVSEKRHGVFIHEGLIITVFTFETRGGAGGSISGEVINRHNCQGSVITAGERPLLASFNLHQDI